MGSQKKVSKKINKKKEKKEKNVSKKKMTKKVSKKKIKKKKVSKKQKGGNVQPIKIGSNPIKIGEFKRIYSIKYTNK